MLKQQRPFELLLPGSCFFLHPTTSRSNITSHQDTHTHTRTPSSCPSAPLCATLARWLWQRAHQQLVWHLLDKCNRLLNKTLPLSGAALWPAPIVSLSLYLSHSHTYTYTSQVHTHVAPAKPACCAAVKTCMQTYRGEHGHTETLNTQADTTHSHTAVHFHTQLIHHVIKQ